MSALRKPSSLEDRLRRIMLEGGFRSIRALTEACGLAPATLAKRIQKERESGNTRLGGDTIQRISKKTGFSGYWIMTGEGSPYVTDDRAPEPTSQAISGFSNGRADTPPGSGGFASTRLASTQGAGAHRGDRLDWGREVVDGLVRQGVPQSRARQAVGALLLESEPSYSSVVELYQASLERLGYAPGPAKKSTAPSGKRAESSGGKRLKSENRSRGRSKLGEGSKDETNGTKKRDRKS